MMKKSLRAKRMEKHHARAKKSESLSLTALMDIFTVLVFFLMANSGDAQLLRDTKTIIMPTSNADQAPKETLIMQVDAQRIIIQGKQIATIDEVMALKTDDGDIEVIIPALEKELLYQASRRPMNEDEKVSGRAVTIQGDKKVPYEVLEKLMATAAKTNYRDISLAVNKRVRTKAPAATGGG